MTLHLDPLASEPLHERAYGALRDALRRGRFPLDRSVPIRALSEDLRISVTPVREALQRLIAEGALELTPTRRIRVPPMTRDLYSEIIGIRLHLEPMAAAAALPRRDAALLAELRGLRDGMETAMAEGRFADYLAANEAFHFAIYRASGRDYLVQLIGQCWLRIGPWLAMLAREGRFRLVANSGHDRMIAALDSGDGPALAGALRHDILDAAENLAPHLPPADPSTANPHVRPDETRALWPGFG